MSGRSSAWLVALALTASLGPSRAGAQYVAGFSRAKPILRASSELPTNTIRQVRFNNDAHQPRLYGVGDDKLLRSWSLKFGESGALQMTPSGTTAWPIYRALRGVIYTLDVQPTSLGDRVAYGGYGAKPSWVNLLHVDRPQNALLLRDDGVSARNNVVNAVAFHPRGTQLAVACNATGKLLLWGLNETHVSAKAGGADTGLSDLTHLAYNPGGERLLLAGFDGRTRKSVVQEWDSAALKKLSEQALSGDVYALAWADNTNWLAATSSGLAQRGQAAPHNLGDLRCLTAVRGTNAYYVLGVHDRTADRTQIAFWTGQGIATSLERGGFLGGDIAVDSSLDGRFIAAGGQVLDSRGMPVFVIRVWDGASRRMLAETPDTTLQGTLGAPIASVGVIPGQRTAEGRETPYKIGFAWGANPKGNLPAYQFQFDRVLRGIGNYNQGLGAEAQPRDIFDKPVDGKLKFFLAKRGNPRDDPWMLPTWGSRKPKCYAQTADGKLVALGYNDGILVCDLPRLRDKNINDKDATVLRSFYGHEGPVTCMNFAPDGTLLLSGSTDGTICAWKIADLANPRTRPASELGVAFDFRQHQQPAGSFLTVLNDPAPGSPGAEAGFQQGQIVAKVFVGGEEIPFSAAQWKKILNAPVPGKELGVTVSQANRRNDLLTVVSRDPLWTLYPQQDLNWLVWTQEGHFDAPVEALDRLSWHINLTKDDYSSNRTPSAVMALSGRDFQELFQKPRIVEAGLLRLEPDTPREHFVPPSIEIEVQGDKVQLMAAANGEPISEVELWLNGYRLARKGEGGQQVKLTARIPPGFRRFDVNHLVGVATITVEDPETKKPVQISNRQIVRLSEGAAPQQPLARKLHYLGVGVTSLASTFKAASPLEFTHHDAVELGRALRQRAVGTMTAGFFEVLADFDNCQPPTEANIIDSLDRLAKQVKADDLAIVFFSGHGMDTANGFRFIAKDTPDKDNGRISDKLINDKLAQLPCRTLLLLDTCHAGGAQGRQRLQDWPGFGLGPMILASCDSEHESFESGRLGLPGGLRGHGLFTASLLECLTGQAAEQRMPKPKILDANNDRRLSIFEWCEYAKSRTTNLSDLAGPYVPAGKSSYSPKILPSLTFLDHKELTFAPAP